MMMMPPLLWSSLLLSLLIQIALLPNGNNAAVGGEDEADAQAIREVTTIYEKMKKTDQWNEERDIL